MTIILVVVVQKFDYDYYYWCFCVAISFFFSLCPRNNDVMFLAQLSSSPKKKILCIFTFNFFPFDRIIMMFIIDGQCLMIQPFTDSLHSQYNNNDGHDVD